MTDFLAASGYPDEFGYIETASDGEDWSPESGWQISKVFVGPRANRDAFIAGKNLGAPAGLNCRYNGDVCTITVRYNTSTNSSDEDVTGLTQKDPFFVGWTLSGNSIQSELAGMQGFGVADYSVANPTDSLGPQLHSKILAQIRAWKSDIDTAIAQQTYPNKSNGEPFNIYTYAKAITDTNEHRQGRARYLFLQLVNSNNVYEFTQPILRKVMTLRSTSEVRVGVQYVGRLFTWEALKVHETTLDAAIILAVTELDAASTQYSFKWRKRMPTVEIASDGKRIITQEYWAYEAFDAYTYGPAITASGSTLVTGTWPDFGSSDPFLYYNTIP